MCHLIVTVVFWLRSETEPLPKKLRLSYKFARKIKQTQKKFWIIISLTHHKGYHPIFESSTEFFFLIPPIKELKTPKNCKNYCK